jgi:hypothetical protein
VFRNVGCDVRPNSTALMANSFIGWHDDGPDAIFKQP